MCIRDRGGTAFVLILLVTLLALASIERNERAMSRLLAEKGSSLPFLL